MRDSQLRRVAGPFGKRTREQALGSAKHAARFGYRWRGVVSRAIYGRIGAGLGRLVPAWASP